MNIFDLNQIPIPEQPGLYALQLDQSREPIGSFTMRMRNKYLITAGLHELTVLSLHTRIILPSYDLIHIQNDQIPITNLFVNLVSEAFQDIRSKCA